MEFVAGGKAYKLAPLKFLDVQELRQAGATKKLMRWAELELEEKSSLMADVLALSARRAGEQVTARQIMDAMDPADELRLHEAAGEVLVASGFQPQGGSESPNAEGPRPTT